MLGKMCTAGSTGCRTTLYPPHCTIWMLQGPRIFYVDSEGTRTEGMRFAVGSGSTYAFGVLDNE